MGERANTAKIDALLASWLCNDFLDDKGVDLSECCDKVLERIDFHGIALLIPQQAALRSVLPDSLRLALRDRMTNRLLWEMNDAHALKQVLPVLGAADQPPLLFKGTALAYSLYPYPATRTRGDTDILVADGMFDRAARGLLDQGWIAPIPSVGEVISIETTFVFTDPTGREHRIDLHRKLSSSAVLTKLFSYEELLERSVPLPDLGPAARVVGKVDALLIACMHRMVHWQSTYYVNGIAYLSADRLIWLYDIHLLASVFTAPEWDCFLMLAAEKGLLEIAGEGLGTAQRVLKTKIPADILPRLAPPDKQEIPAKYLRARRLQQKMLNFSATPGFDRKLQFLRELAFPSAQYMRAQYPHIRPSWLPWLYCVRALAGVWKLIQSGVARK